MYDRVTPFRYKYSVVEVSYIDANKDIIALGSNIGIVFLYDRSKPSME